MRRVMTKAQPSPQSVLLVGLSGSGLRHVFELAELDDRAYLVGSSRQTDFRIDRPGVAAVEFHLERVGALAWLVPAYRGRGLRVDGVPVTNRVCIDGRLILSIGSFELELRVLPDDADVGETSRSSSAPRPLPADYTNTVPTDTACTAVAMKPLEFDPSANVPTQQLPVVRSTTALVAPQQTQRMAPVRPAPMVLHQHTERMAPLTAPPVRDLGATGGAMFETQRLAPVRGPVVGAIPTPQAPIAAHAIRPIEAPSSPRPPDDPAQMVTQETTAFDVAAVVDARPRVESAIAATTAAQAPPISKALRTAPRRPPPWHAFLTQLGTLTKERPVLVLGGGLACALVIALALVGAARVAEPTRRASTASATASSRPVPGSAAPTPSATVLVASAPALVAVPAPAAEPKRKPKGLVDPVLAAAAGHLAAGRVAEASQAYAALAARPEGGEVYASAAALLARRAGQDCSASPSASARCPELLK